MLAALSTVLRGERLTAALGVATAATAGSAILSKRIHHERARSLATVATAASAGLVALGWWAHAVEPRLIQATRTRIAWDGPRLRIVFLSDLHVSATDGPRVADIVRRTLALEPDLVLFGGDAIEDLDVTPEKLAALEPLAGLHGRVPLGLYGVLGNHDGATAEAKRSIRERLEKVGFRMLANERVPLPGGASLVGLGDWQTLDTEARPAFDGADPRKPTILLVHEPKSLDAPGIGRFSVALAGHTHGGQGCIPFTGICPFLQDDMKPYRQGLYDYPGGGKLYVGRGLGTSDIRARLGARPELPLLVLERARPDALGGAITGRRS
jgi:hypothetical protein